MTARQLFDFRRVKTHRRIAIMFVNHEGDAQNRIAPQQARDHPGRNRPRGDSLRNQFCIVGMRTDPVPNHGAAVGHLSQRAIVVRYPDGILVRGSLYELEA